MATNLDNWAALYDAQGRHAEAEPLYQRSLAIWGEGAWPRAPGRGHETRQPTTNTPPKSDGCLYDSLSLDHQAVLPLCLEGVAHRARVLQRLVPPGLDTIEGAASRNHALFQHQHPLPEQLGKGFL